MMLRCCARSCDETGPFSCCSRLARVEDRRPNPPRTEGVGRVWAELAEEPAVAGVAPEAAVRRAAPAGPWAAPAGPWAVPAGTSAAPAGMWVAQAGPSVAQAGPSVAPGEGWGAAGTRAAVRADEAEAAEAFNTRAFSRAEAASATARRRARRVRTWRLRRAPSQSPTPCAAGIAVSPPLRATEAAATRALRATPAERGPARPARRSATAFSPERRVGAPRVLA
jgi:hypothetical protein